MQGFFAKIWGEVWENEDLRLGGDMPQTLNSR
jgi:hypothetical protein